MESQSTMRKPCFVEDDGLASIAGFSGINSSDTNNNHNNNHYCVQSSLKNQHFSAHKFGVAPLMVRRSSLKYLSSLSFPVSVSSSSFSSVFSPRSAGRLFDSRFEEPHFLDACFLCKKPLSGNRDIFMYRGDKPFCSEECRQEQIDIDEAKDNNRKLKVLRSKKESTSSSSSTERQNHPFRTGELAAA